MISKYNEPTYYLNSLYILEENSYEWNENVVKKEMGGLRLRLRVGTNSRVFQYSI
jgi:hypothetical protein